MTVIHRAARKAVLTATAVLGLGTAGTAAAQAPATPAANAPASAPALARKATHGNWDVICAKAADAKETCQAMQILETRNPPEPAQQGEQAPPEGQRVLRLVAQRGPEGIVFSFELPFGLDLRPGIVYQVDANAEVTLPFLTCLPNGCLVSMALKDEARAQMTEGKRMKVGFRPLASQKVVVVEVVLTGLDKALAAL